LVTKANLFSLNKTKLTNLLEQP